MSLCVSEKTTVEPIPEGTYIGVCYMLADLGTQHSEKFGTEKRQCVLGFEIPEVRIELDQDGQVRDLPRAVSRRFSLSLNEKAELRKFLQSWRGKAFTPEELKRFDLKVLLGVPAMIQVIHDHKPDGKVFSKLGAVMPLPKGTPRPTMENDVQFFSFDECPAGQPITIPEALPEWIANLIAESREWRERMGGPPAGPTGNTAANTGGMDDDLPF